MNKQIIYLFGLLLLTFACSEDDTITPSNLERNWMIIEDSEHPIDHQRYLIYKETGVSIYYNDTIGSMGRISSSGKAYTYYERLQVFYLPGATIPIGGSFVLVEDKTEIVPMMNFLKNEILPNVPKKLPIPAILLVRTLDGPNGGEYYRGFNTLVFKNIPTIEEMSEKEKEFHSANFMTGLVMSIFIRTESEYLENNFYGVTKRLNPTLQYLYSDGYDVSIRDACKGTALAKSFEALGFLGPVVESERPIEEQRTPKTWEDLNAYCNAVLFYPTVEFKTKWGIYPNVMKKYEAMRQLIQNYGFTIK